MFKASIRFREILNRDTGTMVAITAFGFVVISIPFLAKHGSTISLALSNLDIAELACVSRFLKEFSRDSQIGFLGQSTHFVWTSDEVWFGPSAIVAFASSILNSEPYKMQSLVMNVLACQGIPIVYLLARESLSFYRTSAIGVAILYAINPVVIYMVWQSFGAQMIAMPLLLAMLLIHILLLQQRSTTREYYLFIGAMITFSSGILLTYHFMLFVMVALLVWYTLVETFLIKRHALWLRLMWLTLLSFGLCLLLNPFRLKGIISTMSMIATGNNGWFIPWLSPDILLGANAATVFVGIGRLNNRFIWSALAGIAFTASVFHCVKTHGKNNHLSFLVGLFLPIFFAGLYFAISGMHDPVPGAGSGQIGSYRSFKITATFCAITLLVLALSFQTLSWHSGKIKVIFGSIFLLASVAVSTLNIKDLASFMKAHSFILPDEFVDLKKLESSPFAQGINVMDTDNFSLLWINYFTMRKPQAYQRFPYGGRPVGLFNQEFSLSRNPDAQLLGNTHDIFSVETTNYDFKYDINKLFTLYRSAAVQDVTIMPGEGWWGKEPTHRWSGSKGRSCSVLVNTRGEGVTVSIEAHYMSLRAGEIISVTMNGQQVAVSYTHTMLTTEPFSLSSGTNTITFTSSLEPAGPVPSDPRTLGIGWHLVIIKFPSVNHIR
jgi:hypothetical protein